MRSSVILASAMAAGALAGPIERRKLVTETRVHVETITVYVTAGQPLPTQSSEAPIKSSSQVYEQPSKANSYAPVSPVAPPPSSSSAVYSPIPVSSAAPEPASSSSAPGNGYQPISIPSAAPTTSTTPTSSATPTTSAIPTTSAAPTTTAAPTTSSQAPPPPAPSSSAPATPIYGVEHISGEIQANFTGGEDYKNAALWHHNRARANHGVANLEWSTECEAAAQTAAEFCDFEHHTVKGQGQNLFTLSGKAYNVTAGITESWYKGEADIYHWWDQEPPTDASGSLDVELFEKYGHLTQMLWKDTTHVGCVTIDCGSKMTLAGAQSDLNKYTVCNYSPAGNVVGSFSKNVPAAAGAYQEFKWTD